jgi:ubiquinone/menaquinone biosynthesis C-methylase UbiE
MGDTQGELAVHNGDPDLYRYNHNNPTDQLDPTGLGSLYGRYTGSFFEKANCVFLYGPKICSAAADLAKEATAGAVLENPCIAAKIYPYQSANQSYVLFKKTDGDNKTPSALPLPPQEVWDGMAETPDQYLASGKENIDKMREIAQSSGFSFEAGRRILEFGCSSGRMIRWLHDLADTCEIWGVDVSAPQIVWCQQHLSPPFQFVTTTTCPHLPFEDGYFDFIYAGSVFTYIADLADVWLLELKRIVRPGGLLYITVSDNHAIEYLLGRLAGEPLTKMLASFLKEHIPSKTSFAMFTITRSPKGAHVFYDRDYLREHWGRYLDVLSVTPEAYGIPMFQTAVLLRKP